MAISDKYTGKNYQQFKLTNVEVHWCHLKTPDTAFSNNKYCLEMHLEDDIANKLRAEGFVLTSKTLPDGKIIKNILKAKKEAITKAGKVQSAPLVVGPDGKTSFTEDIGNGSICNLKLSAHAWPIKGSLVLSMYLDAVQVVKHVPYKSSAFEDVSECPF